ncbi:DUF554 domain-containing protein [Lachnospiraceae bacterium ZAX-1]
MIGTIVNTATILAGSFIGTVLKKGIKAKYQEALFNAMGLAAVALGINAVVSNMPKSTMPVLFIVSLAVGSIIGQMVDLDAKFQKVVGRFSSSNFGQGLSTAILLFCIGTLSILGPIESAVNGDHTYLFTNATLDLVTSAVLATTYGFGIAIAAGVLFLWQGAIYMGAGFLEPFLTPDLLTEISIVGGILIATSGLAILKIKDCKTLNMLPSLLVPILWAIIKKFF